LFYIKKINFLFFNRVIKNIFLINKIKLNSLVPLNLFYLQLYKSDRFNCFFFKTNFKSIVLSTKYLARIMQFKVKNIINQFQRNILMKYFSIRKLIPVFKKFNIFNIAKQIYKVKKFNII
jgi:hypothetical protein